MVLLLFVRILIRPVPSAGSESEPFIVAPCTARGSFDRQWVNSGPPLGLFMSCRFIKQSKPISGLSIRSRRVENDPPSAAPALETKSNSMRWPMP